MVLKIKELITVKYNQLISLIVKPPIVHNTDATLNKIINNRCSVSRFGDGEFGIMMGRDLSFQTNSIEINCRLKEIISSNQENHIVCIPNVFVELYSFNDNAQNYWYKYLGSNRNKIYNMIDKKKEYYDSLVTRLYIDYKDKCKSRVRFAKFKELWNDRDVLIVEGAQSKLGLGNDLFNNVRSINRIICPVTNAYKKYDEILKEVKKQDSAILILIALGPTATVLAYDLSTLGYQAIDIGHIDIEYEWFLQGTVEKVPVKNKYIGDIKEGWNVNDVKDIKYENEIIIRIG